MIKLETTQLDRLTLLSKLLWFTIIVLIGLMLFVINSYQNMQYSVLSIKYWIFHQTDLNVLDYNNLMKHEKTTVLELEQEIRLVYGYFVLTFVVLVLMIATFLKSSRTTEEIAVFV